MFFGINIYVQVYNNVRSIIIINNLRTMFLCIEFHFDELSKEIWGSNSNFQTRNTQKPIASEIKATLAAIK